MRSDTAAVLEVVAPQDQIQVSISHRAGSTSQVEMLPVLCTCVLPEEDEEPLDADKHLRAVSPGVCGSYL